MVTLADTSGGIIVKGLRLLLLGAVAALSFAAGAANQSLPLQPIRDQQAEIRAGILARSGPYANLAEDKRNELLDRQTRLLAILGAKENASELNARDRTEAFNILEWIEATINNTGDERIVCERTRKTGSNRMVRTCRTEREWQEARERARRQMEGSMPMDI